MLSAKAVSFCECIYVKRLVRQLGPILHITSAGNGHRLFIIIFWGEGGGSEPPNDDDHHLPKKFFFFFFAGTGNPLKIHRYEH